MSSRPWLSAVALAIVLCPSFLASARAGQEVLEANTKINGPMLAFDWPAVQIGVGSYEEGPTGLTIIHFKNRPFTDAIVFAGGSAYGEEAITAVATGLKDFGLNGGIGTASPLSRAR